MTHATMNRVLRSVRFFASPPVTLASLALMMGLLVAATAVHTRVGALGVADLCINRFWITVPAGGFDVPVYPGGLTVGLFWFFNLLAAFAVAFRYERRSAGTLLTHGGLLVLLAGQFFAQFISQEGVLRLAVGQTARAAESLKNGGLLVEGAGVERRVPYRTLVKKRMHAIPEAAISFRTVGVQRMDRSSGQTGVSIVLEVFGRGGDKRVLHLRHGEGPKEGTDGGLRFSLQPDPIALPFSLTLLDFVEEKHPGSDIVSRTESRLRLAGAGIDRETTVGMNRPLRYKGITIYQGSDENGDGSVLHVVRNPAAGFPYAGAGLVGAGLLIQFAGGLRKAAKEKA